MFKFCLNNILFIGKKELIFFKIKLVFIQVKFNFVPVGYDSNKT